MLRNWVTVFSACKFKSMNCKKFIVDPTDWFWWLNKQHRAVTFLNLHVEDFTLHEISHIKSTKTIHTVWRLHKPKSEMLLVLLKFFKHAIYLQSVLQQKILCKRTHPPSNVSFHEQTVVLYCTVMTEYLGQLKVVNLRTQATVGSTVCPVFFRSFKKFWP